MKGCGISLKTVHDSFAGFCQWSYDIVNFSSFCIYIHVVRFKLDNFYQKFPVKQCSWQFTLVIVILHCIFHGKKSAQHISNG